MPRSERSRERARLEAPSPVSPHVHCDLDAFTLVARRRVRVELDGQAALQRAGGGEVLPLEPQVPTKVLGVEEEP